MPTCGVHGTLALIKKRVVLSACRAYAQLRVRGNGHHPSRRQQYKVHDTLPVCPRPADLNLVVISPRHDQRLRFVEVYPSHRPVVLIEPIPCVEPGSRPIPHRISAAAIGTTPPMGHKRFSKRARRGEMRRGRRGSSRIIAP